MTNITSRVAEELFQTAGHKLADTCSFLVTRFLTIPASLLDYKDPCSLRTYYSADTLVEGCMEK